MTPCSERVPDWFWESIDRAYKEGFILKFDPDKQIIPTEKALLMRKNPIAEIREELGMSQKGLAQAAGISQSSIYYLEAGMLQNIPERVTDYFKTREITVGELPKHYRAWIKIKRQAYSLPPVAKILKSYENSSKVHPLKFYLDYLDITYSEFASYMCINKNIAKYYQGKQRDMPGVLREALQDVGMIYSDIELLDRLGHEYYYSKCGSN